jgi:hypothetical protein
MRTNVAIALTVETTVVANPFADAFAASFAAFEASVVSHGLARTDAKADASAFATAKRAVCWAAFDLAGSDVAKAEELAVNIATAEGVKPEAVPVYRQRARDAVTFTTSLASADRTKVNPYSLAKKLRDARNATSAQASIDAPHIAEAMEMAAGELLTSIPDLTARIMAGDGEARTLFDAALEAVKGRATLITEWTALMVRLADADDATKARCGFGV